MSATTVPAKQRRASKTRAKQPQLAYAAMHETNAALCLASGLLSPRFEDSAALDHHRAAGRLILEASRPSRQSLIGARGDLPYGSVVLAELPAAHAPSDVPVVALPIGSITRLVFQSEAAQREFEARAAAYADVPSGLVRCDVDPTLFEGSLFEPASAREGIENDPVGASAPALDELAASSFLSMVNRCMGGLAASLWTLRLAEAAPLINELNGLGSDWVHLNSAQQVALSLAKKVDASSEAESYARLLEEIVTAMGEPDLVDGFSAGLMLRKLESAFGDGMQGSAATPLSRFVAFAKDIISLRRDIPDGAFADQDGSAIPRGALLFLLNPEPETLAAVRVRTPRLGPRVYFVAAILVGIRAGFARLPREMKEDRNAFVALPSIVLEAAAGKMRPLQAQIWWDPSGAKVAEATWDGKVVARTTTPATPRMSALLDLASRCSLAAEVSRQDGRVVVNVSRGGSVAELTLAPTTAPVFPRPRAVELALRLQQHLPKRTAVTLAALVNDTSLESGVHCRLIDIRGGKRVEMVAYLLEPAEPNQCLAVIDALWTSAALAGPQPAASSHEATSALPSASTDLRTP